MIGPPDVVQPWCLGPHAIALRASGT